MRTRLWCVHKDDIKDHYDDWENQFVCMISPVKSVEKGDVVYFQGCLDKCVYFLEKGTVKLNKTHHDGKVITVDIVKSGTLFGELEVIEDTERDETAIALENSQICIMCKTNFDKLVRNIPEFATCLNRLIALRRTKVENKLMELLYSPLEERLSKEIYNLIDDFSIEAHGHIRLNIKLTHQDLSELIAATREATTRALNHLKKEGVIDYEHGIIRIPDRERLLSAGRRSVSS